MAPLRGLPFLLVEGMRVCLTPPALKRKRFSTVDACAITGDGGRVLFSCCENLDDAKGIVGCYVLVDVSDVEFEPMDVAFEDLIGRIVVDERHGELGSIASIMETPANDVWVIEGGRYGEVLIPVIESVVNDIPSDGPIAVRIMDGLLDL